MCAAVSTQLSGVALSQASLYSLSSVTLPRDLMLSQISTLADDNFIVFIQPAALLSARGEELRW